MILIEGLSNCISPVSVSSSLEVINHFLLSIATPDALNQSIVLTLLNQVLLLLHIGVK